jgi:hypothetical protein
MEYTSEKKRLSETTEKILRNLAHCKKMARMKDKK